MIPGVDMSGSKSGVWLFFVLSSFLLTHQFLTLDAEGRLDGAGAVALRMASPAAHPRQTRSGPDAALTLCRSASGRDRS
jgi:hypothetical protein